MNREPTSLAERRSRPVCLGAGVVLQAILLAVAFWESHRLVVLGGLTGVFLVVAAGMAWVAICKLVNGPKLFGTRLAESAKGRQQLSAGS
jgi:uncharacterized membrane protein YqjE